jgi:drug/metabolite transporter (DMT)-like permease
MGLKTLSPQFERLILFTYPGLVILLGAALFKMPFKVSALWAFGLSYLGLALVFVTDLKTGGEGIVTGTLWCMTSSISFALYLLLARPLIKRLGPSLFTSISMIAAAVAAFIHYLLVHPVADFHFTAPVLGLGLALAIGATVLPTYLISNALTHISSQANAVIGFINPIITLALAALILGEKVSPSDIFGTLLVLAGVALYTYLDQRVGQTSSVKG